MGHVFLGHTAGSTYAFQHFTDFHRRRSCLTACEFRTFTLGGGGGGIYPNLLSPTRDFLLLFISLFPIMDRGSRPWTLSQFRAHHTHSPRMVNSTSQFSRTRLNAMLHAYECNHGNSYIQFSWFVRNYISNNSNNHVNKSI